MPGLCWTGQPSLCGVAPVPWDWDYAARLDLVVSFLILMLRLVYSDSTSTHISTLHTLRTHTPCETLKECSLAWPRGRWKLKPKWSKSSICCLVWAEVPFWNRLFTTSASCFDFSTTFRKFESVEGQKMRSDSQSTRAWPSSHSIFVRQTPLPTSCRENALVRLCSWAKKTVTFYCYISVEHCDG